MSREFDAAAVHLRRALNLLVFSGAGISADSGIPTFRDDDGLWETFPPAQFATWNGLLAQALARPRHFARFLQAVLEPIARARPNPAHRAVADAEQHLPVTVVTQNIDGLHQQAGSTIVHEVHGSLLEIISHRGRFHRLVSRGELAADVERLARAGRGIFVLPRVLLALRRLAGLGIRGVHRPNLVMFGDALNEPDWSHALAAADNCDLLLQIGCSGNVFPAAMIPQHAGAAGATVICIDPHPAPGDIWLEGTAAAIVPRLFEAAFH